MAVHPAFVADFALDVWLLKHCRPGEHSGDGAAMLVNITRYFPG